jgi:antitoxin ParD1/3/4
MRTEAEKEQKSWIQPISTSVTQGDRDGKRYQIEQYGRILSLFANRVILSGSNVEGAAMPTMNISLPESLKDYVEGQVKSGEYSSASEFIRTLVRREQKDREREQLEVRILEGLSSGDVVEASPEIWGQLLQRLRKRNE